MQLTSSDPADDPLTAKSVPGPRLRTVELLLTCIVWGCIAALILFVRLAASTSVSQPSPQLPWRLASAAVEVALWAMITPVLFRIVIRWPLDNAEWPVRSALFAVLGVVLSVAVYYMTTHVITWYAVNFQHRVVRSPPAYVARLWQLFDFAIFVMIMSAAIARDYFRRYRAHETHLSRLNVQLANARLSALQAQLNQHFLFNAMNGVSSLIGRHPRHAQDMLASLSDLLRKSLERTEPEVTLERELELVRHFLDVMRWRFQDRLVVREDIASDTLTVMVPSLILQPLVENAIQHGIETLEGLGRIEIISRRRGNQLVLSVLNTTKETPDMSAAVGSAVGVGLRNTQERLQQLYGSRQSLHLKYVERTMVIVELTLPIHYSTTTAIAANG